MTKLAESVARQIERQKLLKPGDRVGVAVSGGVDSVALLRLLLELREELGIVLSVIHFHHNLRGSEADEDEKFVRDLAQRFHLPFHSGSGKVREHATEKRLSVEAAARGLRYQYFKALLAENAVNRIATGHTLDDQAETVLMRVARGAGTRGLAGIHPIVKITENSWIVRPLLQLRRPELESHLYELEQSWREDASNRDLSYTRNRVRHEILPQLEQTLNSSVRKALAGLAEISQSEEIYWDSVIKQVMPDIVDKAQLTIKLRQLGALPLALQRRLIRAVAGEAGLSLDFTHVEQVLQLCGEKGKHGEIVELPGSWSAQRQKDYLRFVPQIRCRNTASDYAYRLDIPGHVFIYETGTELHTELVSCDGQSYNSQHLFDPELIAAKLCVRNWRTGDRFWPAHTKAPKKIKELLQERHLSPEEKKLWPVITNGNDIIWVRGFAVPMQYRPKSSKAVLVWECNLEMSQNGTPPRR